MDQLSHSIMLIATMMHMISPKVLSRVIRIPYL